jgi:Zn-dependent protease with chaperone function
MDEEQDQLNDLIEQARINPQAARKQIIWLGWLGYFYLAFTFLLILSLFVLLGWLALLTRYSYLVNGLALILMVLLVFVIRPLLVRLSTEEGLAVASTDVPTLARLLASITSQFPNASLRQILIIAAPNAAVQATSSRLFGRSHQDLLLGLPLLQLLSQPELEAVLAHEMAHVFNRDTQDLAFVAHVMLRFAKLADYLEEHGWLLAWLYDPFINWYLETLSVHLDALAREYELAADRLAAGMTSPQTLVNALTKISLLNRYQTDMLKWLDIALQSAEEPVDLYFDLMVADFLVTWDKFGPDWFRELLNERSLATDSHPSLQERAANLQVTPGWPHFRLVADPASNEPLSQDVRLITDLLNKDWQAGMAVQWPHLQAERLAKLEKVKAFTWPGTIDATLAYMTNLRDLGLITDVLPACERLIEENQGMASAWMIYGSLLLLLSSLKTGDLRDQLTLQGNEALCRAVDLDPGYTQIATEQIEDWALQRGEDQVWLDRLAWHEATLQRYEAYLQEENDILPEDPLEPAGLDPATVRELEVFFSRFPAVNRVWLVRKKMRVHPDDYYVCGLEFKRLTSRRTVEFTIYKASELLDLPATIFNLNKNRRLQRAIIATAGSPLYTAETVRDLKK